MVYRLNKLLFLYTKSMFVRHDSLKEIVIIWSKLAYLFMRKETKNDFQYFPSVYIRYVDDIFAVFDTMQCKKFVSSLDSKFTSNKFTYELEWNGKLPFLDVQVLRTDVNNLECMF